MAIEGPNYKILFSPWRLTYIRRGLRGKLECFICQYLRENRDDENLVVYRSEKSVVIMNRYPYSRGHVLIAPKRHVPSIEQLDDDELLDYSTILKATLEAVENVLSPDYVNTGINIGRVAGAGLEEHLHIHVIPRWYDYDRYVPVEFNEEEIFRDMLEICLNLRREITKILRK